MFILTGNDRLIIALFFEGFLYGLYTGIFAMYFQYRASKEDTNKTQNILFYLMCSLYILSASIFACDIVASVIYQFQTNSNLANIFKIQTTLFAWCDFIAQFILIYRCWIVWGRNIRIVIIPSILAFAFLVIWILSNLSGGSAVQGFSNLGWLHLMTPIGLALSLTVNALVTGSIVFRIFKVFRQVKATSDDKVLSATGGSKLRRIILVLTESAMALFAIQLARLLVSILETGAASRLFSIIVVTHQMLNGIIPTIILVRIAMGLSFHDEKSMEEVAVGSLRFASNNPNSVPETGSSSILSQDIRDDDNIDV